MLGDRVPGGSPGSLHKAGLQTGRGVGVGGSAHLWSSEFPSVLHSSEKHRAPSPPSAPGRDGRLLSAGLQLSQSGFLQACWSWTCTDTLGWFNAVNEDSIICYEKLNKVKAL